MLALRVTGVVLLTAFAYFSPSMNALFIESKPNQKGHILCNKKKCGIIIKMRVSNVLIYPYQGLLFYANTSIKTKGRFLITVPFDETLARNKTICPNCELIFHRVGHVQSFTKKRLQGLLKEAGFSVNTMKIRSFPDWRRTGISNFVKSCVRSILGKFGVEIAYACLFVIATK